MLPLVSANQGSSKMDQIHVRNVFCIVTSAQITILVINALTIWSITIKKNNVNAHPKPSLISTNKFARVKNKHIYYYY